MKKIFYLILRHYIFYIYINIFFYLWSKLNKCWKIRIQFSKITKLNFDFDNQPVKYFLYFAKYKKKQSTKEKKMSKIKINIQFHKFHDLLKEIPQWWKWLMIIDYLYCKLSDLTLLKFYYNSFLFFLFLLFKCNFYLFAIYYKNSVLFILIFILIISHIFHIVLLIYLLYI